ncbi:hypothetical protein KO507_09335 [Gilvimarinus agarilyticus]|uniref:hypothetical protein n=1 Tax=Gilvimarinus sp. 2_MG-2023 TaxID=3062666 RepID=UPI001C0A50DA|nr:hypothetical protein [Gilvimarinus sp. 2_MG-2023]MBU2885962.1 hypothetical protein [Gilvimarinus agarilyticus]MDO6570708.1 hypothetical protein [Gilvimarinus sp. 2_MG-2023]
MNFDSITESVVIQIAVTVILFLGSVILGWMYGPIKWYRENEKLKKILLSGRRFNFFYRPTDKKFKPVTFLPNGEIGEGKNPNENSWRIRRGKLEIFHQDNCIYSRFVFDQSSGRLKHTNDADCGRSVFGQYFEPLFKGTRSAL